MQPTVPPALDPSDPFATPLPENLASILRDMPLGREGKDFFLLRNESGTVDGIAIPTSYYSYPDLMIDIEALANTPDSAPAQIALVFFDRDDASKEFIKLRYDPSPISSIRLGFNVTADTLRWWDEKDMNIDVNRGEEITNVLDDIASDVSTHGIHKGLRVWSRGNAYDIAILDLLYHRTGKKLPWDHWNVRDVRTWLEGCRFKSPRKNDHDALQDAVNQATDIVEATASIPTVSLN